MAKSNPAISCKSDLLDESICTSRMTDTKAISKYLPFGYKNKIGNEG